MKNRTENSLFVSLLGPSKSYISSKSVRIQQALHFNLRALYNTVYSQSVVKETAYLLEKPLEVSF